MLNGLSSSLNTSFQSHTRNKFPPFDETIFFIWLSKTRTVLQTMDVYMKKALTNGPYVPMRITIEEVATPKTM